MLLYQNTARKAVAVAKLLVQKIEFHAPRLPTTWAKSRSATYLLKNFILAPPQTSTTMRRLDLACFSS